ncbi:MAG: DUF5777 family beta-barrel protein [Bacteroidia bacterium]|nr:DUF5777 family beta-barrel protein [Bacteroidia bacterium]MDW8014704.1 DUF5777 family beta-barrel protein [Bacteroidia bacterium]
MRILFLWSIGVITLRGQEEQYPVLATFKGTRLYNFHTTETLAPHHFEFRVAHRFGDLTQGYENFFGIDAGATVRLSFGYSFFRWAEFGVERTGAGKWWNGYFKGRLLRQTEPKGIPFSLTVISMAFLTERKDPLRYRRWDDRWEYLHQLLLARKFSRRFSLMIGGMLLHQNVALATELPNTWGWIMGGARFKIAARFTIFGEGAFPLWQPSLLPDYRFPWSAGIEVETGGHVFQIGITSADGLSENQVLFTRRPLLRLGFNISRIFSFQMPEQDEAS